MMASTDWQKQILLSKERDKKARRILGVPENASEEEIKHAFRRACHQCHPDTNLPGRQDGRRLHLVCRAYRFLTEGQPFDELDAFEAPDEPPGDSKYRRDSNWGYWCWWREKYFDTQE